MLCNGGGQTRYSDCKLFRYEASEAGSWPGERVVLHLQSEQGLTASHGYFDPFSH